jgi:hypothetical protein
VLRRARRRGLRQQLLDRSLDLEPERPSLFVARLSRLLGDVLRRVGTAPSNELAGGPLDVDWVGAWPPLLARRTLKRNRNDPRRKQ